MNATHWKSVDLVWAAVDFFSKSSGAKVEFLIMTPGFAEKLVRELNEGDPEALKKLEVSPSNDPVAYAGMQIVVADLVTQSPLVVAPSVQDMMALHNLKKHPDDVSAA